MTASDLIVQYSGDMTYFRPVLLVTASDLIVQYSGDITYFRQAPAGDCECIPEPRGCEQRL